MANVMGGKVPWHRNDRAGILSSLSPTTQAHPEAAAPPGESLSGADKFDLKVRSVFRRYLGEGSAGSCIGGEGIAALRVHPEWQVLLNVGGCKLRGLEKNRSGDSLDYLAGARWTPMLSSGWRPRFEILAGGNKLTQETIFPQLKQLLIADARLNGTRSPLHEQYTTGIEKNAPAVRAGVALDRRLSNVLYLQLAALDYSHSWGGTLSRINYQNSLQLSSGITLRIGSW
jgi:hypothetical protein